MDKKMRESLINDLNENIGDLGLDSLFKYLLNRNLGKITFSTSLGMEDQVITHFINKKDLPIEIFTLDTGRLFQETYNLLEENKKLFKINIKVFFPNTKKVQNLVSQKGPNSFYNSVEDRKECCNIRKIEPLKRALKNKNVWITGLRRDQSNNRSNINFFQYDKFFDIIKFNPLLHWKLNDVKDYLKKYNVPINELHEKGYPSIGCSPCTRPISNGQDERSGRWWWETSKKECGIHIIKK